MEEELAKKICDMIEKQSTMSLKKMTEPYQKGTKKDFKQGLYFLYDSNEDLIYIGMVGNYKSTSLRDRLVGHGSGAHKVLHSSWYNEIEKGRFLKFETLDELELTIIERVAIRYKKPKYNDKYFDNEALELISKKIKS